MRLAFCLCRNCTNHKSIRLTTASPIGSFEITLGSKMTFQQEFISFRWFSFLVDSQIPLTSRFTVLYFRLFDVWEIRDHSTSLSERKMVFYQQFMKWEILSFAVIFWIDEFRFHFLLPKNGCDIFLKSQYVEIACVSTTYQPWKLSLCKTDRSEKLHFEGSGWNKSVFDIACLCIVILLSFKKHHG